MSLTITQSRQVICKHVHITRAYNEMILCINKTSYWIMHIFASFFAYICLLPESLCKALHKGGCYFPVQSEEIWNANERRLKLYTRNRRTPEEGDMHRWIQMIELPSPYFNSPHKGGIMSVPLHFVAPRWCKSHRPDTELSWGSLDL